MSSTYIRITSFLEWEVPQTFLYICLLAKLGRHEKVVYPVDPQNSASVRLLGLCMHHLGNEALWRVTA